MLEPPFVMRIARAELVDFCTCCLRSVGMRRNDAELTAKLLVDTDARGIYTHGTASLRRYVQLMRDGGIDPRAEPSVTNEGLAWAQMDAGLAVGMVAGQRAMGQAIAKAKVAGVGLVTVQRSNHFGAASAYAMMALEHSMAALSDEQYGRSDELARRARPAVGQQSTILRDPRRCVSAAGAGHRDEHGGGR